MRRTQTTKQKSFSRPGSVTYTLPTHLIPLTPSTPLQTTITLPPNSKWSSGLHWHAKHTEYLLITQGSALITLSGTTKIYTPKDGIIVVPRYARHEWKRASPDGEDLIVKEWTDFNDGQKEVFFRNLSSVIEDEVKATKGQVRGWLLEWKILVICFAMDNFPVFVDAERVLPRGMGRVVEDMLGYGILGSLAWLGRWVGIKGLYKEYTPGGLVEDRKEKCGEIFIGYQKRSG